MTKNINMPYNDWESIMDDQTTAAVSMAFKSLEKGEASPEQQKMALDFLIRIGCRTYDTDWFPEERVSCFAAGRRYVGQQIVRFINLKIGKLQEKKNG
jgi:hypothetical protein